MANYLQVDKFLHKRIMWYKKDHLLKRKKKKIVLPREGDVK
jgi:hypothetical protein